MFTITEDRRANQDFLRSYSTFSLGQFCQKAKGPGLTSADISPEPLYSKLSFGFFNRCIVEILHAFSIKHLAIFIADFITPYLKNMHPDFSFTVGDNQRKRSPITPSNSAPSVQPLPFSFWVPAVGTMANPIPGSQIPARLLSSRGTLY